MAISNESIEQTLKRIKARKAAYAQSQKEKALEGISPAVIQAVRKMDGAKRTLKVDSGSGLFSPNRDFILMMRDYRKIHGCSGFEAHRAISKDFPDALERCIKEANS